MQQPAQPDALAPALLAHPVHAVVPVAAADQRQAVGADRQARVKRAGAMVVQAGGLVRDRWLEEAVALARAQRMASRNGTSRRARRIAGDVDIVRDGVGQPDAVVRDPGADALAGMRQPPVLDVAFENWRPAARNRCARVISGRNAANAMQSCNWSRKP